MKTKRFLILLFCIALSCFFISFNNQMLATESKFESDVREVILNNPEIIIEAIEKYRLQQDEKLIKERKETLNELLSNPKKLIGESPRKGADSLDIILIEFSDFQCPFCLEVQPILKNFMERHNNEVAFVYKHFPLSAIHPEAFPAAQASWAAGRQGKFWQYHDALFENQEDLGSELYLKIAKSLNINIENFKKDFDLAQGEILKDIELASRLKITSTPFFIFNDRFISGTITLEDLENILAKVKN